MDDNLKESSEKGEEEEHSENPERELTGEAVYDDDFFEFKDYEYDKDDGKEWEMEEMERTDWEKEAKKTVNIELEVPMEKRRTIYELDSFASSGPSASDIKRLSEADIPDPTRRIRYSHSMGMSGIARLNLSPLTQKIIGCVIGENVTTEYPWVYVRKEIIEDNIELHEESSDFLAMKNEIFSFPDTKMLIGYAPSSTDEAQFYICLTEEGRDAVVQHIQMQREEHENRVKNALYKTLGTWREHGSGAEIDESLVTNTRPLLEIEVISTAELLNAPMNFLDRQADDQRDGYVDLLPYRDVFNNVSRDLIHREIQVTPMYRENEAQTEPSMPMNTWIQYKYDYSDIDLSKLNVEQKESLRSFLQRYTNEMCNQASINTTWDIYTNDYWNLVRNEADTKPPVLIGYKEHQSFSDGKRIVEKVINDLSWHPLWTGIVFAAYTRQAKSSHFIGPDVSDEVIRASSGDNFVLVWSFNDCLTAKLVLECPREVTAVSTCPQNGNLIIGGCANGQVAIWHIPGKIEHVEAVVVHTTAQVKYRIAMRNLTIWMKESIGSSVVRPAAMSSLKDSPRGAITQIMWVSPYHKVDKNGQITTLPEDTAFDDLTCQFVTSSQDGTVAFWDLKSLPRPTIRQTSKKDPIIRPDALTDAISPFKVLDRVFKPEYVLVVQYPNESRKMVITSLSMYTPKFKKERVDTMPIPKDITIRRYYKYILEKPDFVMKPYILVGTIEGDFGCITWEGFEFTTEVTVNREICKWSWIKRVHDGPVTHTIRSKYYNDVVATVGGKIFAVWKDNFGEPLIWKRSDLWYTACTWGSFRPTVLILARMDGSVEIWDLLVSSSGPTFVQSLSGRIITGIYTHELPLDPQCVGFCDYNGILRMFLAPVAFVLRNDVNIEWMKRFLDRQEHRIAEFQSWQKDWNATNAENIEEKKRIAEKEAEKKQLEEEERIKAEMAEAMARLQSAKKSVVKRVPWQLLEAARERWKAMELQRMQQAILEKKGLRKDDLEKQREPILKIRQEAKRKRRKIREILRQQDQIFEDTIAFLFPEQHQERKRVSLPEIEPTVEKRETALSITTEFILKSDVQERIDPEEEIVYNFMEIQTMALVEIQNRPFQHRFNWQKILSEGKWRRISMDEELRKLNKPKRSME